MEHGTETSPYIEEQRSWLILFKEETNLPWSQLAKRTGIPQGTISNFGGPNGYNGKKISSEMPIAEKVERFRLSLVQQADLDAEVPEVPEFYATETTEQLERMLGFAQRGQIVIAALEAGCSKTTAAKRYAVQYPNVFYVEVPRSAGAPNNLFKLILAALGVRDPSGGTFDLSRQISDQFRKVSKPLLIIDEAQHLAEATLDEIRYWNDATDVGIALFGNVGILQKFSRFAQLDSRLSLQLHRRRPLPADVEAMADAWKITNVQVRKELQGICAKRGGLRKGTKALQLARMMATAEQCELNLDHLRSAWSELDAPLVAA
jgi:hypothetical protein